MIKRTLRAQFRHIARLAPQRLDFLASQLINGPMLLVSHFFYLWLPKGKEERWVFSLDFHASVSRDIAYGLRPRGVRVIRRVISFHNGTSRRIFKKSDPVPGINQTNWRRFSQTDVDKFLSRHRRLFKKVDAFLVSYPTSFVRLYETLNKPILVVNPIRYEHPLTNRSAEWDQLDDDIIRLVKNDQLRFVSNNQADADYASHYLGGPIDIVPSVCGYINHHWTGTSNLRLTYSHYSSIGVDFQEESDGQWRDLRTTLGKRFSWRKLLKIRELFYIPYAPSTMMLFEAATAGLPVAIPSLSFLKDLRRKHRGVFSQLTFHEMSRKSPEPKRKWIATDFDEWEPYASWWYSRSDFLDRDLMPNVRLVDSFQDLLDHPSMPELMGLDNYRSIISARNASLVERQSHYYSGFLRDTSLPSENDRLRVRMRPSEQSGSGRY